MVRRITEEGKEENEKKKIGRRTEKILARRWKEGGFTRNKYIEEGTGKEEKDGEEKKKNRRGKKKEESSRE